MLLQKRSETSVSRTINGPAGPDLLGMQPWPPCRAISGAPAQSAG